MGTIVPNQKNLIDLVVVMPVYNEEGCIEQVVRAWAAMLACEAPNHLILVLNDGSTDQTARRLEPLTVGLRVEVLHKANSGHGPTILVGYRRAATLAPWVFQVDSDNELSPDHFPKLWRERERYDFLFGVRQGRNAPWARRIVTAVARGCVALLFKPGVRDVNVPYRLMRAGALLRCIQGLPNDTFAPNVIVSGRCARLGYRIFQTPIAFERRRTGEVSIKRWKLLRAAARAFRQTWAAALRGVR
jgi:glycosyltransferase involved in cell wall biosynthesis